MTKDEILSLLEQNKNQQKADGMRRYGINGIVYGISMPDLRNIAKKIKKNHALALDLWNNEVHEAKLLATLIADYKVLTDKDIDRWIKDFDSWDLVDQACINLYRYSDKAIKRIKSFAENDNEFIRRTAFSLIATMCVNKKIEDNDLLQYLPLIEQYSSDERPMVHQACDWALRAIGKRSDTLKTKALETAHRLNDSDNKFCRYVGKQSIKEFEQGKKVSCVSLKQKDDTKSDSLKKTEKKSKPINKKVYKFNAVIIPDNEIDAAWVEFPYDAKEEFGKSRVKVHVTFDGEPYDGLLVKMGTPCHIIGILKSIRKKIGKQGGDMVKVTLRERE